MFATNVSPASRGMRAVAVLGLSVAAFVLAPDVVADKTSSLVDSLQNDADFRVRVGAALVLGTSNDPKAVQPLCKCLADKTETESVRVACAAALGKLKQPGGDTCLASASNDKSKKVAAQAATSLKALGGTTSTVGTTATTAATAITTGTCAAPPATGKPKYYVGIDVDNKTSRPDVDIKGLVATEVRCQLLGSGGRFKIAPNIDPKDMNAVATKEKLDGYLVTMQIDPIKLEGGKLKIRMKLVIMTPDHAIRGEIEKWLLAAGIAKPTKSDEDDLLKKAARWLADRFAEMKP